jgi:dienelactone hydrolase
VTKKIEFKTEDGTILRGLFYAQERAEKSPVIVMAHGFSGTLTALRQYADAFCEAGFAVLLYDHRGFGVSDGQLRQHIDPFQQIADFRDAITFAQSYPGVDPDRVGIWGSSYAGGHVLHISAADRRVKCVVSQIPFVSGHQTAPRLFRPDVLSAWRKRFNKERQLVKETGRHSVVPVFSTNGEESCALPPPVTDDFIKASQEEEGWKNEVTVRSVEFLTEYEPGSMARFISPTPVLMIVARHDRVAAPELALATYNEMLEPKRLLIHGGGHFGTYTLQFEETSTAAVEWFREHLRA